MNDFENLNKQRQILLKIKIDGYVEAAFLTAKANNIGLSEAACLTMQGLIKELVAHSFDRRKARTILEAALQSGFPGPGTEITTH